MLQQQNNLIHPCMTQILWTQKRNSLVLLGCLMNIVQNQKSFMSRNVLLFRHDVMTISTITSFISHHILKDLNSSSNNLLIGNLYNSCSLWFSAWDDFMNKLHENKSNLSTSFKKCLNKHYDLTTSAKHCQKKQETWTLSNTRCEVVPRSMKSKYISDSAQGQSAPWRLSL